MGLHYHRKTEATDRCQPLGGRSNDLVRRMRAPRLQNSDEVTIVDRDRHLRVPEQGSLVGSVFSSLKDPWARKWLVLALALNLVAAFYSWGFHQFDEHFQILEFASYKLGNSPAADLPWEFDARIRPWLQPAIAVSLARVFDDPFVLVRVLRIFSALLGWLSTVVIASCCTAWFENERLRRWAILGSCFLWFFPYQHARFSSEGWAASLFFLGFVPLVFGIREHRDRVATSGDPSRLRLPVWGALSCGALLGFAFDCRYQVGIMIAAGGLWALRYGRLDRRTIVFLGLGLAAAILLGLLVDAWGYGSLALTPWNYLYVNLVQDRAAEFGVAPWWNYFWKGLARGLPPLSLFLMVGVLASWLLKPRFSLTWVTLAYFLVHVFIGHKEFRFLFPLLPAVPIQVAMAFQAMADRGVRWRPISRPGRAVVASVVALMLAVNGVALIVATVLPPRMEVLVFRQIFENSPMILVSEPEDPFVMAQLPIHFYRHPGLRIVDLEESDAYPNDGPVWVLMEGLEPPPGLGPSRPPGTCERRYTTMPDWLAGSPLYGLVQQAGAMEWVLYECRSDTA